MSIGAPSALGTLLVQRLDAVLGTTLSQQTNIISGARPDAISQPANAESAGAGNNTLIRHPQESVNRTVGQLEQGARQAAAKSGPDARLPTIPDTHNALGQSATTSASTRLGFAARTILALLAEFPEHAPPVIAKTPLSNPATQTSPHSAGTQSRQSSQNATPASESVIGKALSPSSQAVHANSATAQAGSTMAPMLAKALAQALQSSGLFYESHLADVAFGRRPALSLATEPQAQMNRPLAHEAGSSTSTAPASTAAPTLSNVSSSPLPAGAQGSHTVTTTTQQQASLADTTVAASQGQATHHPATNLPTQAHLLVRQQLEVLANQVFSWQGEAWPNAPMQWEVARQNHSADADSRQEQHWGTRIRITLPNLGSVDARLTLTKSQLFMRVSAPDSADALTAQSGGLHNRLASAGLMLGQLTIDAEIHSRANTANASNHDES